VWTSENHLEPGPDCREDGKKNNIKRSRQSQQVSAMRKRSSLSGWPAQIYARKKTANTVAQLLQMEINDVHVVWRCDMGSRKNELSSKWHSETSKLRTSTFCSKMKVITSPKSDHLPPILCKSAIYFSHGYE
jgi:hypothetical protein